MKVLLAAIFAAIVSFAWGFTSWTLLSWHQNGIKPFRDEGAVAKAIKANVTTGSGLFILPYQHTPTSLATPEEKQKMQQDYEKAVKEGPYVYATIRPGGAQPDMLNSMLLSLLRSFLASLVIAALAHQTALHYLARVGFVAGAGLFAGLVAELPAWIWMEFPARDLIVNMADYFIEWMLAGLVIAFFVGREPTAADRQH